MIARALYSLAWVAALPLALARLAWRSRREPRYRAHLAERLGRYPPAAPARRLWVHAVSLGETRAAAPLVEALMRRYPDHRILLTHMTPTGRAAGEALFGDRVDRAWLPYDVGFAVDGFLRHWKPEAGVLMETELWPRLVEACRREGIPVALANARLSERSARRYGRWPALARWAFGNLAGVAAQSPGDAQRIAALGAPAPVVTGNVKFDLAVAPEQQALAAELRARIGPGRRVWLAGSTREGEEALLLDAFAALDAGPEVLLAIVPRHPQRFAEVAALAAGRFVVARRSEPGAVPAAARVWIGDSLGEMLAYYGAADVVVMGGTLLEHGGQNLIEACALGAPVVLGPHTFNFSEAARGAIEAGAAVRVADAAGALREAQAIAGDAARRERMGAAGLAFVAAHRGAVARFEAWFAALPGAPRPDATSRASG